MGMAKVHFSFIFSLFFGYAVSRYTDHLIAKLRHAHFRRAAAIRDSLLGASLRLAPSGLT